MKNTILTSAGESATLNSCASRFQRCQRTLLRFSYNASLIHVASILLYFLHTSAATNVLCEYSVPIVFLFSYLLTNVLSLSLSLSPSLSLSLPIILFLCPSQCLDSIFHHIDDDLLDLLFIDHDRQVGFYRHVYISKTISV